MDNAINTEAGSSDQTEVTTDTLVDAAASALPAPKEEPAPMYPLAIVDQRFAMLVNTLKNEMQKKFMKFYQKTKDASKRPQAAEMVTLMATMSLASLRDIKTAFGMSVEDIRKLFDDSLNYCAPYFNLSQPVEGPSESEKQTSADVGESAVSVETANSTPAVPPPPAG